MNMNQIINMVIRRIMSIAINKGINAGVDQMAKRKNRNAPDADIPHDTKQLRQTARAANRITRL